MRQLAKIAAVVLAAVVCAAPLAACGNKTDDSFFGRHILTEAERAAETGDYDTYPAFAEIAELAGSSIDTTAFSATGVVIVDGTKAYDVAAGRMLFADAGYSNLEVVTMRGEGTYYYYRVMIGGKETLLTPTGEAFCTDAVFGSSPWVVTMYRNGRRGEYLRYTENTADGGMATRYAYIDGQITAETFSADELEAENGLPGVGERFDTEKETLSEFIGLSVDDAFTDSRYVRTETSENGERALAFYNAEGKRLSRFVVPFNALPDSRVYADGRIFYQTADYVDPLAADGYNYVDGGKFLVKSYSFGIDSGKTEELSLDYVVTGLEQPLYDFRAGRVDAAYVTVIEMTGGIAIADYSRTDTYIIDGEGAVQLKGADCYYGLPGVRVGDNFLTDKNCIVDRELSLVAELPANATVTTYPSVDGIVVTTAEGVVGVVDYAGKVKVPFTGEPFGVERSGCMVVAIDGDNCVLDLNTGATQLLSELCGTETGITVSADGYLYVAAGDAYDVYAYTGAKVFTGTAHTGNGLDTVTVYWQEDGMVGLAAVTMADGVHYYKATR